MNPRLLVITGPEQGASYPIDMDSFAIGRDARNQLSLTDASASREHCVILRHGDDFLIRDMGSFNGTLVNDERVTESVLVHGDRIKIGKSLLRFLTDEETAWEETSGDTRTIEIPTGQDPLPAELENSRDLHTLLRMSVMLHSFHALYKVRRSPARRTLERHLLEFVFEVIPASRGAILLYEDDLSEPSLLSPQSEELAPHRPVVINRTLVRRVTEERCGLIVENPEAEQSAGADPGKSAALLLVPLLIRERVCGIVYLEGTAFWEPHLQLLVAIAQIASMALENAFHLDWLETENERLESELHPDHHMIGDSPRLRELQRNILRAAQANSTVLIVGETGTGKELGARHASEQPARRAAVHGGELCGAGRDPAGERDVWPREGRFHRSVRPKEGTAGGGCRRNRVPGRNRRDAIAVAGQAAARAAGAANGAGGRHAAD